MKQRILGIAAATVVLGLAAAAPATAGMGFDGVKPTTNAVEPAGMGFDFEPYNRVVPAGMGYDVVRPDGMGFDALS